MTTQGETEPAARGRVALVTGATRGIGRAVAAALVARGMTVLVGARDLARGVEVAAEIGAAHAVALDVTDEVSVSAAAAEIERRHGRLDVLVNNAGINAGNRVPSAVPAAEMRQVYETNVFGVVTVTRALLPLLHRAPAARVVNVSSLRGSIGADGAWAGQPSMSYSSSKTALNAITAHYARELAGTPIKVNAASPGHVATDFNGHRGTRTPEQGAAVVVVLATLDADGPTGVLADDDGVLPW